MKKRIITVALLATIGMVAVSCHKEENILANTMAIENNAKYSITYLIDGVPTTFNTDNDDDVYSLMSQLMDIAASGRFVRVYNQNTTSTIATKETVTYVTTDKTLATTWSAEMVLQGYQVSISYNQRTGEYTCTATR